MRCNVLHKSCITTRELRHLFYSNKHLVFFCLWSFNLNFLFNYSYWLRSFLRLDIRNKTTELTFHILSRDVGFVFLSYFSQLRWLSYLVIRNDGKFSHLLLSFLNFFWFLLFFLLNDFFFLFRYFFRHLVNHSFLLLLQESFTSFFSLHVEIFRNTEIEQAASDKAENNPRKRYIVAL